MDRLVPAGRTLIAIGLIGMGIDHFLTGSFVTGRAPDWPESHPGGAANASSFVGRALLRRRHAQGTST